MRKSLHQYLSKHYNTIAVGTCKEARKELQSKAINVAILDLSLPDGDGLSLIETARNDARAEVVVITAFPKAQTAVRALKAGALDYINKPFELDEFEIVLARAVEVHALKHELAVLRRNQPVIGGVHNILGNNPQVEFLREEITQVAQTPDTTVLIRGESGTGKELVAEAIHHESSRRNGPLVRLNCSSLPANMLEAELFGHERGAYTDAKAVRKGLVELANGGTLFLDEVGDLPLSMQPKLLRLLESKTYRRLGGNREFVVDVRFVAATNRALETMVVEGSFREDLFFRLKVFEVVVPPLRKRMSDLTELTQYFVRLIAGHLDKNVSGLTADAYSLLEEYEWPGNIRELRNLLERAVIISKDGVLDRGCFRLFASKRENSSPGLLSPPTSLANCITLRELEHHYVKIVYELAGNNKTKTAEALGLSRATLREKLKSH